MIANILILVDFIRLNFVLIVTPVICCFGFLTEKLPLIAAKEAKAISLAIDGSRSGNESSRTLPRWNFVTVTGAFFAQKEVAKG